MGQNSFSLLPGSVIYNDRLRANAQHTNCTHSGEKQGACIQNFPKVQSFWQHYRILPTIPFPILKKSISFKIIAPDVSSCDLEKLGKVTQLYWNKDRFSINDSLIIIHKILEKLSDAALIVGGLGLIFCFITYACTSYLK